MTVAQVGAKKTHASRNEKPNWFKSGFGLLSPGTKLRLAYGKRFWVGLKYG
jgi:hypothetical protein